MPLTETKLANTAAAVANGTTFGVFYSDVVDGRMWCPDCRNVEVIVKDAFNASGPHGVIVWVGSIAEWRSKDNAARTKYNVNSVPTIVRFENGKETARLVDTEIMDAAKLSALIADAK